MRTAQPLPRGTSRKRRLPPETPPHVTECGCIKHNPVLLTLVGMFGNVRIHCDTHNVTVPGRKMTPAEIQNDLEGKPLDRVRLPFPDEPPF